MADDLFDMLIKVRDLAETANANAQEVIKNYRQKPDFSWAANSRSQFERKAQERAAAKEHLIHEQIQIKYLHKSITEFREGTQLALDTIRRAVGLQAKPIFVGEYSYPTAHEAAEALATVIHEAWQTGGGYDAIEYAPNRLQARSVGHYADYAIESGISIWRGIRRHRKHHPFPLDLYGQIQQEFEVAWNLAEQDITISNDRNQAMQDEEKPMVISANDPRDKWLYEEAMKGTAWDSIFRNHAKQSDCWEPVTTLEGIRSAAIRYQERKNLPLIPPRQSGRKPKKH